MSILELFKNKPKPQPQPQPEIIEIQQAPNQLPLHVLKPTGLQPGEAPSIGKRNEQIINAITTARKTAIELARMGFHVLDIEIGGRNPRITVNPCRLCEQLGGVMVKVKRLTHCEVRTMAANINGVQIEWQVPHEV